MLDRPLLFFWKTYVWTVPCYSLGKHTFGYLLESPRRGDANKYSKRMIYKKNAQKYPLSMLWTGPFHVSL